MLNKRVHRFLMVLLSLLAMAGQVRADSNADLIARGNEYFKVAEYDSAAASYEEVLDGGVESAKLYYNLGNAYYKMTNIPAAILNYERALKLDPKNEDLQFNLKLSTLKTVDEIEVIPSFFIVELGSGMKDLFALDTWGWIAIIALWLSAGLFFVFSYISSGSSKRLIFFVALLLVATSLGSFGLGYQKFNSVYNDLEAIIFSPSVIVKSSPDLNGKDLFLLHEGTKVEVLEEIGDWDKISLADGSVGWIPSKSIEKI